MQAPVTLSHVLYDAQCPHVEAQLSPYLPNPHSGNMELFHLYPYKTIQSTPINRLRLNICDKVYTTYLRIENIKQGNINNDLIM